MNYKKIYDQIIDRARVRDYKQFKEKVGYCERHHVIPKCIELNENTVPLTTKEHLICHHLLWKLNPEINGLQRAFWNMINRGKGNKGMNRSVKISSFIYEDIRKNLTCTPESIQKKVESKKISDAMKTEEERKESYGRPGEQNGFYGKKHTEEARKLMSIANNERQVLTCPHCKVSSTHNMKRYHFDNCKLKNTL